MSRAKLSIFALSLNFNDFDADMSHEEINNSMPFKLKWISFPQSFPNDFNTWLSPSLNNWIRNPNSKLKFI